MAAKVLIWVAVGAGFYLVPEVSRRRAAGEDTRPVLAMSLGIVAVCAIPVLLIFAGVPHLLLSVAFGSKRATASGSLLVLGGAFAVLAATYLAIQYMLALGRTWFLLPLGVVAVCEPFVLVEGPNHPAGFAATVLGVQAIGAVLAFLIALRRESPNRRGRRGEPRAGVATGSEQPELGRARSPASAASAASRGLPLRWIESRFGLEQPVPGAAPRPAGCGGAPRASSSGMRRKSARSSSSVEGV